MTAAFEFWWERGDALDLALAEEAAETDRAARLAHEGELERASQDVQAALENYEAARRRHRCAPHGQVGSRACDLRQANTRVLAAEVRYAELKGREPQWD